MPIIQKFAWIPLLKTAFMSLLAIFHTGLIAVYAPVITDAAGIPLVFGVFAQGLAYAVLIPLFLMAFYSMRDTYGVYFSVGELLVEWLCRCGRRWRMNILALVGLMLIVLIGAWFLVAGVGFGLFQAQSRVNAITTPLAGYSTNGGLVFVWLLIAKMATYVLYAFCVMKYESVLSFAAYGAAYGMITIALWFLVGDSLNFFRSFTVDIVENSLTGVEVWPNVVAEVVAPIVLAVIMIFGLPGSMASCGKKEEGALMKDMNANK